MDIKQNLLNEIDGANSTSKRLFGVSLFKSLFYLIVAILFALYVNLLVNGSNSLSVIENLEDQRKILKREIERLKQRNGYLQQQIFKLEVVEDSYREEYTK